MKPLATLLLALAALPSLSACAHSNQTLVTMEVRDLERGLDLPQHPHRGRTYVEGQPGHRYAIALQNLTGERVLAVVSVDGVNVISGETAATAQSGYVLGPWQRLEIRGWRKSMADVAEFQFTALGDSYAARTGRPHNVGVIGLAAFREKRVPPPVYRDEIAAAEPLAKSQERREAPAAAAEADALGDSANRSAAPAVAQQLGTGHGQRRYDPASHTTFERESRRPSQLLSLYYDASEALVARGILPPPRQWQTPQAFPVGFVPDP